MFNAPLLGSELAALETIAGAPARYVVAFSGGLDSTALLHAIGHIGGSVPVCAVYVDHGLQDDSADWGRHCEAAATAMEIPFLGLTVDVDRSFDQGLEAAARSARYAALQELLRSDDWLLTAHHRDDQAETLLLNLMRGSGPAGLAGIARVRPLGAGWLVRPLLQIARSDLEYYARSAGVPWIEDPSNADRQFDRNFLRHDVMPLLAQRWPDVAARLARSARHAAEAVAIMRDAAAADLDAMGGRPDRLPLDALTVLPKARQRNLIRFALYRLGLPLPSASQLDHVLGELMPARSDAQPLVRWTGAAVRRYRNAVYIMHDTLPEPPVDVAIADTRVDLGPGLGVLVFEKSSAPGLSEETLQRGLRLCHRRGGEEIQPQSQSHTKQLKKLLQQEGIVPWMRDRLPLLYAGGRLVAVADLWLAQDAVSDPGTVVRWIDRPALH